MSQNNGQTGQNRTSRWCAQQMLKSGISVIPVGTNKLPFGRWKQFQDQLPTPQQLDQAFDKLPHNCSIATIGGAVSGQLVIIDFDADDEGHTIYPQLAELVESQRPEIWKRLVKNTTPSRGYHLRYRVDGQVEGNTKLATSAQGQVRIETRGEGGYALAPPSANYDIIEGSILNLPVLSLEEHCWLLAQARTFDQTPAVEATDTFPTTDFSPDKADYQKTYPDKGQERAGDRYNQLDDYRQLLAKQGWALVRQDDEREYWRRPGKDQGWSATFHPEHRVFCVHSTNAHPLKAYARAGDGYTPFELLTALQHQGDFTDCARQLFLDHPDWGQPKTAKVEEAEIEEIQQAFQKADQQDLVEYGVVPEPSAEFNADKLIPEGSWLHSYFAMMQGTTDAPDAYIGASGLQILAFSLRHLQMPFGTTVLKPNLWVVLVGPSTNFRKTTVLNSARRMILANNAGHAFPETTTPEGLAHHMASDDSELAQGCFFWSEIGQILKTYEKSYMQGMKELLTNLYDNRSVYEYHTKSEGLVQIEEPLVSIMACSTQHWLSENLKSSDLYGGFLPRFLWFHAHKKSRHNVIPETVNISWRNQLEGEMAQLAAGSRDLEFVLVKDTPAYQKFADFTLLTEQQISDLQDNILAPFLGRLQVYCLKFSMIFQVMMSPVGTAIDPILSEKTIDLAVAWCDYLKHSIKVIVDDMDFNEEAIDRKAILKAIGEIPGISRSQLIRKARLSARKTDSALETLFQMEMVIERCEKTQSACKPSRFYHLLKDPVIKV